MSDVMTPEQRSRAMSHIKGKDTSIEVLLRKALWHKGIRYRKNYKKLPGTPDIAITKYKIAIFCDSEFFHGYNCNGVQREHNKKLNNGLPILHKVPPKRDYGRYFCIMAEKGGTSHGGLTEKLSPFFHAKKQEVNAYGR